MNGHYSLTKEELSNIYNNLSKSEQRGIRFGLFPISMKYAGFDHDDLVGLMEIAEEPKNGVD